MNLFNILTVSLNYVSSIRLYMSYPESGSSVRVFEDTVTFILYHLVYTLLANKFGIKFLEINFELKQVMGAQSANNKFWEFMTLNLL
jgi:hypothetical protein